MPFYLPSGARDPDDKDPRYSKDFIAPTMDSAKLGNFQNAFHADAIIWIGDALFLDLPMRFFIKLTSSPLQESGDTRR
jgi:hypothetical protein